jgi:hypothetical protein
MAQFDNQQFTEKVLKLYAESLRQRLPRVKFMLDEDSGAVRDAIGRKVYRLVREYTNGEVLFCLDDHLRGDGSVDEEMLLAAVANELSVPVIDAAEDDLRAEDDDPFKRIGAGQLWILHKTIPLPFTLGAGQVYFAQEGKVGLFGQTWFDQKTLNSMFTAKTEWGLARSGEIKKELLDINALRRGESPL